MPKPNIFKAEHLAKELLAMSEQDKRLRSVAAADGYWNVDVDERNTARLKELVDWFGWPTKSLVGEHAANAALLLAQHADHDPVFQQQALKLMRKARQLKTSDITTAEIKQLAKCIKANRGSRTKAKEKSR